MNKNTPLQNAHLDYTRKATRLANVILDGYGAPFILEATEDARKARDLYQKLSREASELVLRSTGGGVDGA